VHFCAIEEESEETLRVPEAAINDAYVIKTGESYSSPPVLLKSSNHFLEHYNRKRKRVLPDGNCFFRSASDQLFGDDRHHAKLRQYLAKVVSTNFDHYKVIWTQADNEFEEHVKTIHRASTWATQVEILALSEAFNMPVYIANPHSMTKLYVWSIFKPGGTIRLPSYGTYGLPSSSMPYCLGKEPHVEIVHNEGRDHYDSVIPKQLGLLLGFPFPFPK